MSRKEGKGLIKFSIAIFTICVFTIIVFFSNGSVNETYKKITNNSPAVLIPNSPSNVDLSTPDEHDFVEQGDLELLLNKSGVEQQNNSNSERKVNLSFEEINAIKERYEQDLSQIEKSQAAIIASEEALLNNQRILDQLGEEWSRNSDQLDSYQKDQRFAQAAMNYELPNNDEVEALSSQLKTRGGTPRPDYPTGMSPQVVNRVQDTTGISSTEIENLMNK